MKRLISESALRISKYSILRCVILVAVVSLFVSLPPSSSLMTVYTVDTTTDSATLTACTAAPNDCSLRGAIIKANSDATADTIMIPAGTYTLTLGPADDEFNFDGAREDIGDLDILNGDLTIVGAGASSTIIDGGGLDRIFDVNNFAGPGKAVNVTIQDVWLRNGNAGTTPEGFDKTGGAIQFDGFDITSGGPQGALTITNCKITGNTAANLGGGVLVAYGSLDVSGSEISNNTSLSASGGGISYDASAFAGSRTLQITNSTFSNNRAPNSISGNGGGLAAVGSANMTIENNSFSGNQAGNNGGAIQTEAFLASNTKTITKNKFENNSAKLGGGVHNINGVLTFSLNLVAGNTASGDPTSTGFRQGTNTVSGSTTDLTNNWWGCNEGPQSATGGCDRASGPMGFGPGPHLLLSHTATPSTITVGGTSTLQADFFTPSSGSLVSGTDLIALNGRTVSFSTPTKGTLSSSSATITNGQAQVTYTHTDGTGGLDSVDATVDQETVTAQINIGQAPEITCPANITTGTDLGQCTASVAFSATATGSPTPTITYRIGSTPITSPHVFQKGTTTVTATASNGFGADATCSFTVTVTDDESPSISCPSNITRNVDPGTCGAVITYTAPVGTDNCPGAVTVQTEGLPSGSTFPVGTTTNTFKVTDAEGHEATCSFTVTVNDNEAPSVTVPANITVSTDPGQCTAVVNFDVTATDNCPGVTVATSHASGSAFPKGTTTVTATATDASGRTDTKTFTVTVNDTEKPVVSVPDDIVVSTDEGQCAAVVNYSVTATDNCPGVTVVSSPPSGSVFPKGTTTVTATATDASGRTDTKTFTVTVNDTEAPSISCPADIVVNLAAGQCDAVVHFSVTATDNCPGVTVTTSHASGSVFPTGTTTVNATATDSSGNTRSCSFKVIVNDVTPPTITTNGQTPVLWPPNHQYVTFNVTDLVASASDDCDPSVDVSDVIIEKVESDEAEDGPADGSTLNDIVIAPGCKTVQLRAERQASGNGRVYTITFRLPNTNVTATSQVIVPKTQANGGAVKDATQYMRTCQ